MSKKVQINELFNFLLCENEAKANVAISTTSVMIEVELTCKYTIVVIAASIEPRVRRINKVRIVSTRESKSYFLTNWNLH